jgi:hypothetical protein
MMNLEDVNIKDKIFMTRMINSFLKEEIKDEHE